MKILRVAAGILLLLAVILSILHINKGVEAMSALPVIVIDAGHGGMDGGAVAADGTLEKNLNLEIALKLRDKFEKGGYAVVMTREDDYSGQAWEDFSKSRDMNRRAAIIESSNAAAVISVHQNSFSDASCNGTQVFYSSNNEEGSVFAESIRKSVCERLQPGNSRVVKDGTDLSRVLYLAKCPAVIVECGFMSNEKELECLKNEEYQTYMADAVYNGTVNFLKG